MQLKHVPLYEFHGLIVAIKFIMQLFMENSVRGKFLGSYFPFLYFEKFFF